MAYSALQQNKKQAKNTQINKKKRGNDLMIISKNRKLPTHTAWYFWKFIISSGSFGWDIRRQAQRWTYQGVRCQSIKNKIGDMVDHVSSNNIDIWTLTETWLKLADDVIRQECQPIGYSIPDCPHQSGRVAGGTGLSCRSNLMLCLVRSRENN